VRSLSILLQDVDVVISEHELNDHQKTNLREISSSCQNVLDKLEQTLDKYRELESRPGHPGERMKRIWKKLKWEPEEIRELRDRITANVALLDAFLGRLSR
jgi:hypothetical protein